MKEIQRKAQVHWAGDLKAGRGLITTETKALDGVAYSLPSRFEMGAGTNPEELIGAAHASCFTMMLAKILGDEKKSIEQLDTSATVKMQFSEGGAKITEVHLSVQGKVMGTSAEEFRKAAENAKENCPLSKLLKPGLEKITLEAKLI